MSKEDLDNISLDSLQEARAQRVQNLRDVTGLSRRAFAKKYNLPISTLQNWEDVKGNGLTEKGARKLAALLKAEGIYCSPEWLLHNIGAPPRFSPHLNIAEKAKPSTKPLVTSDVEDWFIADELRLFHQHFPNLAIDFVIEDDGMAPRFIKGEWVAGIRCSGEAIKKIVGEPCIIQLANGEILLRTLEQGTIPNRFNLSCNNPHTTVKQPKHYDVELISAAPVVWIRRKLPKSCL